MNKPEMLIEPCLTCGTPKVRVRSIVEARRGYGAKMLAFCDKDCMAVYRSKHGRNFN